MLNVLIKGEKYKKFHWISQISKTYTFSLFRIKKVKHLHYKMKRNKKPTCSQALNSEINIKKNTFFTAEKNFLPFI